MNEIKFRQPIINNGIFSGWHYWGYLEKDNLGFFTSPLSSNDVEIKKSYQDTGRKDKNGKEIYSGDILEDNSGAIYIEGLFEPAKRIKEPTSLTTDFLWEKVIGNIYEHKFLLDSK